MLKTKFKNHGYPDVGLVTDEHDSDEGKANDTVEDEANDSAEPLNLLLTLPFRTLISSMNMMHVSMSVLDLIFLIRLLS